MHLDWLHIEVSPSAMVIALATVLIAVVHYCLKTSDLPPGPYGVPFFGFWPFINHKQTNLQFDKLKKKHGDVFSFTCTGRLYINLGSVKAVRDALIGKSDCFTKRNEDYGYMTEMFGSGLVFQSSEEWKANRKFFVSTMKERGLQSIQNSMSGTSLYDSINSTVDTLRENKGEPVNIIELLSNKCNTTLRHTLFGENGITEETVQELNELFALMMASMTAPNLLPLGNIARYIILPLTKSYRESQNGLRKCRNILYKVIEEHKSSYDEDNIRDIIDEYIRERNVRRSKGDPTAQYFTDRALVSTLVQIVGDGSLSVSMFITIFLIAVVNHPEEQEKIYKELVEVVGSDRQPTIEDKSKLTYTNAFILEVLRTSSDFFPFFPSLQCTKDTTLRGYRIPKGSITLLNFFSAHNDPETYEEPEKFDPTRFIAQDGKQRADLPITFGVGKRACIGEAFTMMQVLLFVTTIIKNFHLSVPEGIDSSINALVMTGKWPIIAQPRNQK